MLTPAERAVFFKTVAYKPTKLQEGIFASDARVKLISGGERGGKSRTGAEFLASEAAVDSGLYWIVGPDYEQAKPEFLYIYADMQKLGAVETVSMPEKGGWSMHLLGGGLIQTKTGDDDVKLASVAPKGILMTEAAQQAYQNFVKLRGRIAEQRGWLMATGTFETSIGWYADVWKKFQGPNEFSGISFSLPSWDNPYVYPGGRNDPEMLALEAAYDPDEFQERFGGVPCPPRGVVFKEFEYTTHVAPVNFGDVKSATHTDDGWLLPNDTPIEMWIDPGYAGAYSVGFYAIAGGLVFGMDEVYKQFTVAEAVILECRTTKGDLYERALKSQYTRGFGGVIDIAGRQHAAMESNEEVWRRVGGILLRSQPVPITDGIHRHRTFLKDPATGFARLIHSPKQRETIAEYGKYKYPKDTETRPQKELPIDKFNHSMKAIAYGLVANYGFVDPMRGAAPESRRSKMEESIERAFAAADPSTAKDGWIN